jgi:hypothetical protein
MKLSEYYSDHEILRTLSKKSDAKKVITKFRKMIVGKKKSRKFQICSIQYCITKRLKTGLEAFISLLSPKIKKSARDWYESRLLGTVFGSWIMYIRDEQLSNNKLSCESDKFFKIRSLKLFQQKLSRIHSITGSLKTKYKFGLSYFIYLCRLRTFEIFRAKIAENNLCGNKYTHGRLFMEKKQKSHNLGSFNVLQCCIS